ncbi:peptide deformylase, partial [Candidatus Saccharibacteria bacterium]|nr:peptide deformylase [Candidatus Saccharibacteria bacterium]
MNIITVPDPRLRKASTKVNHVTEETHQIIKQMVDSSLEWEKEHPHELSAAMAAPQLGINKRIIIIR